MSQSPVCMFACPFVGLVGTGAKALGRKKERWAAENWLC